MLTNEKASAVRLAFETLNIKSQHDNQIIKLDKPWARISILDGDEVMVDQFTSRTVGVVMIQLFSEIGKGDNSSRATAKIIKDKFTNKAIGGVHFRVAYVQTIGRREDAWQVNIICPFWSDERK